MRLLLPAVSVFVIFLAPRGIADEKPTLVSHVYRTPQFILNGLTRAPEAIHLRAIAPTTDGEKRYNALKWLEDVGVECKPGMSAIVLDKNKALVVKAPAATLESIDKILSQIDQSTNFTILQIELSANLWSYDSDRPLDPQQKPHTLAELREKAGGTLQTLDSHSVLTRSGNRVVAVSRIGTLTPPLSPETKTPAKNEDLSTLDPSDPHLFDDGSRGSVVAFEPSIGPDRHTIDFQVSYQARLPQSNGEPDIFIQFFNNAAIMTGQDLVVFSTATPTVAPPGRLRHRVLTISAQITDDLGRTLDKIEKLEPLDLKSELELIRRAQEGIPNE